MFLPSVAVSHSTAPRRAAPQGGRGPQARAPSGLTGNLRAAGKGGRNTGVQGWPSSEPHSTQAPAGRGILGGMDTPEKRRWYRPSPAWLVLGSLPSTGLLFLSERWRWFSFNEHKGWTVLIAVAGVGVVLMAMLVWWAVGLVVRWPFQFGIRTLLVLMVAVALPFSWLSVVLKKAREQGAAVESITKLGGEVHYDYEADPTQVRMPDPKLSVRSWLRKSLGDDFFADVISVYYRGGEVTDAGLEYLKGLTHLQYLGLINTRVTDEGMDRLRGLSQLERLWLNGTEVTDAGLKRLEGMPQLHWLDLCDTKVTDAGMEHLKGFPQLGQLWLNEEVVTDASVNRLRQELPKCHIIWYPR